MVDEAVAKLPKGDISDDRHRFLRSLLSSKQLNRNDVSTLILSLMTDGLNAVSCMAGWVVLSRQQQER